MRRNALIPVSILALILAPLAAFAGDTDWQVLHGEQLRAALEGRTLVYTSGAWQEFRATGRTLYNAGEDSWGYWRIQGDQYCSQWPPSDLWACYDLQASGGQASGGGLRFVGASGEVTEAGYAN